MLTWLIRKTSTLCVPCELKLRIEPWAFRSKVCLPDHSFYCSYCHYHDHDEVVVMVLVGRVLLLQIPMVRCLFFSMLQSCMVLTVCLPHHSLYCSLWHYHDHDKLVVMVLVGRVLLLQIPMVRCLGFFSMLQSCMVLTYWWMKLSSHGCWKSTCPLLWHGWYWWCVFDQLLVKVVVVRMGGGFFFFFFLLLLLPHYHLYLLYIYETFGNLRVPQWCYLILCFPCFPLFMFIDLMWVDLGFSLGQGGWFFFWFVWCCFCCCFFYLVWLDICFFTMHFQALVLGSAICSRNRETDKFHFGETITVSML